MSTTFTALFGEHPDVRVVEYLAGHPDLDYNLSDLARNAGVSRPAAYKVVSRLLERGVLVRTRRVGASWFYALDPKSPLVRPLLEMEIRLVAAPGPRKSASRRKAVAR